MLGRDGLASKVASCAALPREVILISLYSCNTTYALLCFSILEHIGDISGFVRAATPRTDHGLLFGNMLSLILSILWTLLREPSRNVLGYLALCDSLLQQHLLLPYRRKRRLVRAV